LSELFSVYSIENAAASNWFQLTLQICQSKRMS